MDDLQRQHWRFAWRTTRWQLPPDYDRAPLPRADGARFALSAWNPGCRRLPGPVNHARHALLMAELRAYGLSPLPMSGGDASTGWHEDFWLISHVRQRDLHLLKRYGQLAGLVVDGCTGRLLWADGVLDDVPTTLA
jgi:hypothetical protein